MKEIIIHPKQEIILHTKDVWITRGKYSINISVHGSALEIAVWRKGKECLDSGLGNMRIENAADDWNANYGTTRTYY